MRIASVCKIQPVGRFDVDDQHPSIGSAEQEVGDMTTIRVADQQRLRRNPNHVRVEVRKQ